MRLTDSFLEALDNIPPPGRGAGYHAALLGIANKGARCGYSADEIFLAIEQNTPRGGRAVPSREIAQAVEKAVRECTGGTWKPEPPPPPPMCDPSRVLRAIQAEGAGWTEADIWEASPKRVEWDTREDAWHLLQALYASSDMLFVGERNETRVYSVANILTAFEAGEPVPPHIIPNPLTGEPGLKKDGGKSYRADSCVAKFKYAVVEFDTLPRHEQIAFWAGVALPVVALIDSGGKSIHGWVAIDGVQDADAWEQEVERGLFSYLIPLGVDAACRNEARLSRLPGHFRAEKGRWQRLLYLAPQGRRVKQ